MDNIESRDRAKKIYYILAFVFIVSHVLFFIDEEVVNVEDRVGGLFLLTIFVILIAFTIKGSNWVKWLLTLILLEFGVLFIFAGIEIPSTNFIILGIVYLTFAVIPNLSSKLKPISIIPEKNRQLIRIEGHKIVDGKYQIPSLLDRFKALILDWLVLFNILTLFIQVYSLFSNIQESVFYVVIPLTLLYEVVLTTYFTTVGQKVMRITIRKFKEPTENINLFQSFFRTLTKYLLGFGILSIVAAYINKERRAIHDLISSCVVVGK